jgi:hypothetical protein
VFLELADFSAIGVHGLLVAVPIFVYLVDHDRGIAIDE